MLARTAPSRAAIRIPASAEMRPLIRKIVIFVFATDTPEKRATAALLPMTYVNRPSPLKWSTIVAATARTMKIKIESVKGPNRPF